MGVNSQSIFATANTMASGARRLSLPTSIPLFSFRRISWNNKQKSNSSSISIPSPGQAVSRSSSNVSYASPTTSSAQSSIKSCHGDSRSSSSLSLLLDLTKAKLQEVVDAQRQSKGGNGAVFTDRFALALPAEVSQDKTELDYLRRMNAEAAAAAQAKKASEVVEP